MQRPGVRTHEPKSPILQDVRPLLPEEIRMLPGEARVMVVVCAGHGMSLGTRQGSQAASCRQCLFCSCNKQTWFDVTMDDPVHVQVVDALCNVTRERLDLVVRQRGPACVVNQVLQVSTYAPF